MLTSQEDDAFVTWILNMRKIWALDHSIIIQIEGSCKCDSNNTHPMSKWNFKKHLMVLVREGHLELNIHVVEELKISRK